MFKKYGEMDSYVEINELAENLFNEGDFESLREMAKENGISEDAVELYLEGEIPELCDAMEAAIGKIEMEEKELKPKEIMQDWVEYLKSQCMENKVLCHQVRKKGGTGRKNREHQRTAGEKDPRQSGQNIFPQYALSVLQKAWMLGTYSL